LEVAHLRGGAIAVLLASLDAAQKAWIAMSAFAALCIALAGLRRCTSAQPTHHKQKKNLGKMISCQKPYHILLHQKERISLCNA
jgi:hypothetical protein